MQYETLNKLKEGLKAEKVYSVFNPKGKTRYTVEPEWISGLFLNREIQIECLDKVLQLVLDNGTMDTSTRNTLKALRTFLIIKDMRRDITEFQEVLEHPGPGIELTEQQKKNIQAAMNERKQVLEELALLHPMQENTCYTLDTYRKYLGSAGES